MMRRLLGMAFMLVGFVLLCQPAARAADKVAVVATFSILADLTQKIGGDAIALTTLVGANEDAHAFEPTADAQRAVAGAQLLVANGLGFEPWLERLIDAAAFKGNLVIATTGIEPLASTEESEEGHANDEDHDPGHGAADPHAFQDPRLVLTYIDNIAAGLAKVAPEHAADFQSNAEALRAQFRTLNSELTASLGALPAEKKRILTSHDAFQYFGHAYGIDFIGVQGVSTESEPSAQDLKQIVEQIKSGHIKAVFIENMNDPRFVESLAGDTGVTIGGDLYSDALSAADGPASDLISLYRHNQQELLRALK
jgi:zinc/manganese transport system substrate-binding protein